MQVKDIIINHGIEKLHGALIEARGDVYEVRLRPDEIEGHSVPDYEGVYKGLNAKMGHKRFHERGNYRFSAVNSKGFSIWVYKTDEVVI